MIRGVLPVWPGRRREGRNINSDLLSTLGDLLLLLAPQLKPWLVCLSRKASKEKKKKKV